MSTVERILARVERDGECWIYTGADNGHGYGAVWDSEKRKVRGVHRVMFEDVNGEIPSGFHLDHLCRRRKCCNPTHLEAVEPAENTRRGVAHRLLASCKYGHPYDETNTKLNKNGTRECRECHRRRSLAYVRRKKIGEQQHDHHQDEPPRHRDGGVRQGAPRRLRRRAVARSACGPQPGPS